MQKKIIIAGAGLSGIESAYQLSRLGMQVTVVEASDTLGGNVKNWYKLFPDFRNADEIMQYMNQKAENNFDIIYNTTLKSIQKNDTAFSAELSTGRVMESDAVVIATGFDIFDAHLKEEYGYGIYNNVITSVDLEKMLKTKGSIQTFDGKTPKRIGIVHCVGSRDEKINNIHCSKLCCITGVKQAIEIKEHLPESEVFCFYMDLRMYGRHFEELYYDAQLKHRVNFIRGRLSESFENQDQTILVKVEDTLMGKPLKMSVDLLILLAGVKPNKNTSNLLQDGQIQSTDGFIEAPDRYTSSNKASVDGIFYAGSCTGIKSIPETIADSKATAIEVYSYLNQ